METMEAQLKKVWFEPERKSVEKATTELISVQKDNYFSDNKKSIQPEVQNTIEKFLEDYKKEKKR